MKDTKMKFVDLNGQLINKHQLLEEMMTNYLFGIQPTIIISINSISIRQQLRQSHGALINMDFLHLEVGAEIKLFVFGISTVEKKLNALKQILKCAAQPFLKMQICLYLLMDLLITKSMYGNILSLKKLRYFKDINKESSTWLSVQITNKL